MLQASSLTEHATGEPAFATIAPAAVESAPAVRRAARRLGKRSFDVAMALVTLFLLAPLMGLVALLVSLDGGPVLVRHPRVGRDGRIFGCFKYRTMIDDAEAAFSEYLAYNPAVDSEWISGRELRFDPRVTAIGRMLRSSALDELPQLLNILRGDMSFIGPRPVEPPESDLRGEVASLPGGVRPGLTDLRKINIRGRLNLAVRFKGGAGEGSRPADTPVLARMRGAVSRRRSAP